MKHQASQDLFAYWNELRGLRAAPERSEVDPGAIRGALGDTIMLAREQDGRTHFRLAGTRVCALFGRELKNEAFLSLWDTASRGELHQVLSAVTEESVGVVAGVTARLADGETTAMELLLLPLFHRGTSDGRLIGTLAPLERPAWLGTLAVQSLALGTLRYVGPQIDRTVVPRFVDVPVHVEDRVSLTVYEGGRS